MSKETPSGSKTPRTVSDVSEAPASALLQLLSPDGYYTYLNIPRPKKVEGNEKPTIDEELVKKNFRRLSLKHHPDRRGGDTETFRVLKRAQVVLMNAKLREQYDILGLDLDDEEEHHQEDDDKNNDAEDSDKDNGNSAPPPVPETLVSHLATTALAGIMQLAVRTVMMGAVSVFLCRWRLTVFPAFAFLLFIAYRIQATVRSAPSSGASYYDMLSPLLIGVGLLFLHKGRDFDNGVKWSFTFWTGEALVMTMFTYNSIPPSASKSTGLIAVVAVLSILITLWLRGMFWRYMTIIGMEAFVALVAAMAFPLMELVLEEILKEKLRKVGEKVRAHAKRMEEFYASNPQ